jgi:hypothetical protein
MVSRFKERTDDEKKCIVATEQKDFLKRIYKAALIISREYNFY